ncbi:MAG: hypothetical protein ACK4NX_00315, partial [Candidatus Paceibacteria bacterium]
MKLSEIAIASPDVLLILFLSFFVFLYSISFGTKYSFQFLLSLYITRAGLAMSGSIINSILLGAEPRMKFIAEVVFVMMFTLIVYWVLHSTLSLGTGGRR